ncbi:MAG: DUF5686 and carboxypeptidase regulatory-like domain-containing protein [Pelobium sp.]
MKNISLFLFFLSVSITVNAQSILKGLITDEKNQPVPFATIFVKGTSNGTSANANGEYNLKLKEGKYDVAFTAVGYKQLIKAVELKQITVLNAVLEESVFELNDVIVNVGGEDPAYKIIRSAIRKRKSYLKEVQPYSCDVYIKGIQRLLKAPEKFLGQDLKKMTQEIGLDSNRTGIIYQSESQSVLSFSPPDSYHEEMISSKVAGSNRSFSFNRASELIINFYDNYQEWNGLSNRPFVSPIAENAFFYYDYKLIGSFVENGEMINKIQLLPKRKYDPAYRGYIYIVEDSWRIHSADFTMSKESNINLLDSLSINQQFVPVGHQIWMPSNVKFEFKGGLLGFKFGGYFVGVYSNYVLNPKVDPKTFREIIKITKEVNKKDSVYWSDARPIPLTAEEETNYVKKDSIAKRRESKPYLDSLDKVNNNLKFSKIFLGGYNPRDRYKKEFYHIDGLLNSLSYNTVEGFAINYEASYSKRIDTLNNRSLFWKGNLRYGLANELFSANTSLTLPVKTKSSISFSLGSDVVDLNNKGSMGTLGNTFNSLLYEKNYPKFYQQKFGEATFSSRIRGGLNGSFGLAYQYNNWLPNSSSYSIKDYDNREFTSNNPFTPTVDQAVFPTYQNFKLRLSLSYNFSNKYVTYPTGKFYVPSKWPIVTFKYVKAIPDVFASDAAYDFMSFGIRKSDIKLGFYGNFSFSAEAGKFLNAKTVYYPDYNHFRGNNSLAFQPENNQFFFLDFYNESTNKEYFEGHAEHNFSGFFTNKIPLLRKLKLQELLGVNYLATPTLKNYTEAYVGISYIGLKGYYGLVYEGGKQVKSGFRIAYGF